VPKGGTAWVAIAKQLQLSQWELPKRANSFKKSLSALFFTPTEPIAEPFATRSVELGWQRLKQKERKRHSTLNE
jgi:hypothetical protein